MNRRDEIVEAVDGVFITPRDIESYIQSKPYTPDGVKYGFLDHDRDDLMEFYEWVKGAKDKPVFMRGAYVKCINASGCSGRGLTLGKNYEVLFSKAGMIQIKAPRKYFPLSEEWYLASRFEYAEDLEAKDKPVCQKCGGVGYVEASQHGDWEKCDCKQEKWVDVDKLRTDVHCGVCDCKGCGCLNKQNEIIDRLNRIGREVFG